MPPHPDHLYVVAVEIVSVFGGIGCLALVLFQVVRGWWRISDERRDRKDRRSCSGPEMSESPPNFGLPPETHAVRENEAPPFIGVSVGSLIAAHSVFAIAALGAWWMIWHLPGASHRWLAFLRDLRAFKQEGSNSARSVRREEDP
jgi:hypothetical protein